MFGFEVIEVIEVIEVCFDHIPSWGNVWFVNGVCVIL